MIRILHVDCLLKSSCGDAGRESIRSLMMDLAGYYWDSCVWIDLIRGSDNDRVKRARHLLRLALQGKVTLYISAITLV